MRQYWLGVVGSIMAVDDFESRLWWCFPPKAKRGDYIFMYCTKTVSEKRQGIFCLCKLKTAPKVQNEKNLSCSGYGKTSFAIKEVFFMVTWNLLKDSKFT